MWHRAERPYRDPEITMAMSPPMTPTSNRARTRPSRSTNPRVMGLRSDELNRMQLPHAARRQQLGTLIVLVQAVLLVACLLPVGPVLGLIVAPAVGWALIVVAALIGGLAVLALGRDLRITPIPAANARLHRNGIYAFIRHPMYLALVLGAVGVTLVSGRWLAILATVGLIAVLCLKAHIEDVILQRRFGWEFALYASRVPAIVPRPWRSHRR